ncbi:MAG: tRNA 2-thiocytidine biosynthesis protein TtcA [Oscillospiraceae bacterium]|nr:tRNA 2-thiocytidine biosynthesis protein TtcA [Oscillospiraceae bacterium]
MKYTDIHDPRRIELSLTKKYNKTIWGRFIKGIKEYELIEEGDRIAVCISGGKDSMLMAKCIQHLQKYSEKPFEAEYIVMDPGYSPKNLEKIKENAEILGIPIKIFTSQIFEAVSDVEQSPCYLCARMRRGHLYSYAESLGCNKIALGHHFDDVIETIVMGMFYGAQMQTMMPKLWSANFTGMQLIRPLYMVREQDIIAWARYNGLEFIQCACRFTEMTSKAEHESMSKRREIKSLLAELRKKSPCIDMNIFRSVENVNLETIISYHRGTESRHFLDDYHDRPLKKEQEKNVEQTRADI